MILTAMYQPKDNPAMPQIWTELHKLFGRFVDGNPGWIYSQQSRWSTTEVFFRLIQASVENTSLEDICTSIEGCSADTVQYRIKQLDYLATVRQLNDMLRYTAQSFKFHKNKILMLAVDITDQPWYGNRDHELSVGSQKKEGTMFFNRYFTACILTEKYRIPIYFLPLRQEDGVSPFKLMQALVREVHWWCPFSRVLADSWFFSKDLFDLLETYKIDYLFNLKKQKRIKQKLNEVKESQRLLARASGIDPTNLNEFYQWLKKNRLLTFKFESNLRLRNNHRFPVVVYTNFVKRKKGRKSYLECLDHYVFTSNIAISGDYLRRLYKRRWGIETQYRVAHQFQAKTTSLCTNLRIMLVGLSFVLTGLWLQLNLILNRIIQKKSQQVNYDLALRFYSTDKLIMTVSKVKRLIQSMWWLNMRVRL